MQAPDNVWLALASILGRSLSRDPISRRLEFGEFSLLYSGIRPNHSAHVTGYGILK